MKASGQGRTQITVALEGLQSDPSGAMLISYQGHTAMVVALFAIVVPLFVFFYQRGGRVPSYVASWGQARL